MTSHPQKKSQIQIKELLGQNLCKLLKKTISHQMKMLFDDDIS